MHHLHLVHAMLGEQEGQELVLRRHFHHLQALQPRRRGEDRQDAHEGGQEAQQQELHERRAPSLDLESVLVSYTLYI